MDWLGLVLLLLGLVSTNLLPGDKRLGHHHHGHHHGQHLDEHHPADPSNQHHHIEHNHEHHTHMEELETHKIENENERLTSRPKPKSKHRARGGKNLAIDFSSAVLDEDTGLQCVRSTSSIQSSERESLLTCRHSRVNICHYTYVTKFKPFSPRVCEDFYNKKCNIVFTKQAQNVTEEACYQPYRKSCEATDDDNDGEKVEERCVTVSDTSCVTRYHPKAATDGEVATKHVAITTCDNIPQTLCSNTRCSFVKDEPVCHNKTVSLVTEVPQETCDLVPSKICRRSNKLVPHLEPVEKCEDQPREVCTFGLTSPTVQDTPLVTKWCYNDTDKPLIFGQKLIKQDRKPKSNKFKHKNIPSAVVISRNPLLVPKIHNEVIDDAPVNEDVNDRKKKPKKPSIFENKLISQSLLPPLRSNDPDRSTRKINKPRQNGKNTQQNPENEQFSFIDTFLKTAKQDPESSSPPSIDTFISDNEVVDAELISDVFTFADNEQDVGEEGSNHGNTADAEIEFETKQTKLGALAKVVTHDQNSPVSKTIIIQNNPRAHKVFGVRNPPKKFSTSDIQTHLKDKFRESKAANVGNRQRHKDSSPGPAKSISRDHKNDHIDFLSDNLQREQSSLFGFGISEISDEEKEQYRSEEVSAEFNFKTDWNNKAPPPALFKIFRASHNGANEGFNDEKSSKKKYVKTTPGRISSEPEIRLNKNSNSNYVQVGFQNTLKNIHNTVQDVIEETVEGNKGFNEINNDINEVDDIFIYKDDTLNSFTESQRSSFDRVVNNNSNQKTYKTMGDKNKDALASLNDNLDNYRVVEQELDVIGMNDDDGNNDVALKAPIPPSQSSFVIQSSTQTVNQPQQQIQSDYQLHPPTSTGPIPSSGITTSTWNQQQQYNGGKKNSAFAVTNYATPTQSRPRQNVFEKPETFKRPETPTSVVSKPSEIDNSLPSVQPAGNSIQKNVKDALGLGRFNQENLVIASYRPAPAGPTPVTSINEVPSQNVVSSNPTTTSRSNVITDTDSSSDLFQAPSTLLYGFVPITTTEKVTFSPEARPPAQVNYNIRGKTPVKYRQKPKPSYKPPNSASRRPKHLVLDAISKLLEPITQTLNNLLRG